LGVGVEAVADQNMAGAEELSFASIYQFNERMRLD
jgi:hypothetical protein